MIVIINFDSASLFMRSLRKFNQVPAWLLCLRLCVACSLIGVALNGTPTSVKYALTDGSTAHLPLIPKSSLQAISLAHGALPVSGRPKWQSHTMTDKDLLGEEPQDPYSTLGLSAYVYFLPSYPEPLSRGQVQPAGCRPRLYLLNSALRC